MSTFSYRPPEGRKIFGLHFRWIFKILLIIASFFLSFLRLTGREPFYYRIIGFCVLGPSSLTIFSVKLGVESLFQPISWEGFSPMSFPFFPVPKGTVFLPAQHTSSLERAAQQCPSPQRPVSFPVMQALAPLPYGFKCFEFAFRCRSHLSSSLSG